MSDRFNTGRYILGGLCLFLSLLAPLRGFAALDDSRFTDEERIGYGFSRLTGEPPDFGSWVRQEDVWQKAPPDAQNTVMESQLTRLKEGMAAYEPNIDLIHSVARVSVSWAPEDIKFAGPHDITIIFDKPGAIFPFQIGDRRIDVMPEQIDNKTVFQLSAEDFAAFVKNAGRGGAASGMLEFYLLPVAADAKMPMTINGEATWPMIVRVAHMSLWAGDKHQFVLWNYDAPWYKQEQDSKLLSLYNK